LDLTVANKITADTIETTGTTQVKFEQGVRIDGNVILGYDNTNEVIIRGTVDLQTPITFSESATLGDGNDTIAVNCGEANNFTVVAQNVDITAAGKLTAQEIESAGDLTVQGDLFVNGTQTIIDTTTLTVTDNVVVVNNGEAGAGITAGTAGISIDRGSLPDAKIIYNETTDKWQMGIEGSMVDIEVTNHNHDSSYLRTSANSKPVSDNVIDLGASDKRFANLYATNFHGSLTGLASQASALETSRTISLSGDVTGSVGFNGTANAAITTTVANDSHTHDTRYFTETEQDTRFLRRNANTTPDVDLSYNLGDATHRWNNVYATNFKGNADTASKWQNVRTVYFSGGLSGSFDFDGSGDINVSIPVVNDSHTHDTRYYTETECNDNFVNVSGDVMTGQLDFGDNIQARFGTDLDMQMFHNGTDGVINNNTGNLYLMYNSEAYLAGVPNSYVYLYYDNAWRLRTTSAGVELNGIMQGQASSALYADLAEKLTCSEEFVYPGTVMKVCETGQFDVEECGTEFARNVIGVVSENPAYLMNSDEKGITVAYTGKVHVRVKGPVGKGNPIVSAGEGVARGIRKDSELLYSFGVTLEENLNNEEKLVMCIIK
jgi:hypothetical protein